MPIQSFRCADTAALYRGPAEHARPSSFSSNRFVRDGLKVSSRLEDLQAPPGNRLESLRGDRAGQYSICTNDQWRVCFVWADDGAHYAEIIDCY